MFATKIAIIGAGLGGLTFGAFAAKEGHQVHIFDKNHSLGGIVALLEHEGSLYKKGIVFKSDDEPEVDNLLGALMKGVLTGQFSFKALISLASSTLKGEALKKHYMAYPSTPDAYPAWEKKSPEALKKSRLNGGYSQRCLKLYHKFIRREQYENQTEPHRHHRVGIITIIKGHTPASSQRYFFAS